MGQNTRVKNRPNRTHSHSRRPNATGRKDQANRPAAFRGYSGDRPFYAEPHYLAFPLRNGKLNSR